MFKKKNKKNNANVDGVLGELLETELHGIVVHQNIYVDNVNVYVSHTEINHDEQEDEDQGHDDV